MKKIIFVVLMMISLVIMVGCKKDDQVTSITFFDNGSIRLNTMIFEDNEEKEQFFLANLEIDGYQGLYWVKMIEEDNEIYYQLIKVNVMVETTPPIFIEPAMTEFFGNPQKNLIARQGTNQYMVLLNFLYPDESFQVNELIYDSNKNYSKLSYRYVVYDSYTIEDHVYLVKDEKKMIVLDSFQTLGLGHVVLDEGNLFFYHPDFDVREKTLIEEDTHVNGAFIFYNGHSQFYMGITDEHLGFRLYDVKNQSFSSRFEINETIIRQKPAFDHGCLGGYMCYARLILETDTRLLVYHVDEELWFEYHKSAYFAGYHTYVEDDHEYLMIYERDGQDLSRTSVEISDTSWRSFID